MSMLVWLTLPFLIFAVFDPSLLTVCINYSFLHLYLLFYYQFLVRSHTHESVVRTTIKVSGKGRNLTPRHP